MQLGEVHAFYPGVVVEARGRHVRAVDGREVDAVRGVGERRGAQVVHLDVFVWGDEEVVLREARGRGVVEDVGFFGGRRGGGGGDVADGGEEVGGHCACG